MPIYHIPHLSGSYQKSHWDIDEPTIRNFRSIDLYENEINELIDNSLYLRSLPVKSITTYLDSLTKYWLSDEKNVFLNEFSHLGISFLINFMKKSSLEMTLKESLHSNIQFLDNFFDDQSSEKKLMAHPRGIITHWLAGNVPILGMISLIQGIITKNTNIIKLPKKNGLVLPRMLSHIRRFDCRVGETTLLGQEIFKSCMFIYCDKEDKKSQHKLSISSDVRVAWGGREAVETVMSLPKKYGTDDVIFGPKYSFAVIGRNSYNKEKLDEIAYNLAMDASVFEQQGCNSPHTVFFDKNSSVKPLDFAKILADSMDKVLKRIPKQPLSSDDALRIVNIRAKHSFTDKVFSSKGTEWTIILSDEKGLADACFHRTIFIRIIDDIFDVLDYIKKNTHQTIGLSVDENIKNRFAIEASKRGAERLTELGRMSTFDYPWDGMFPLNRFVRWVSLK